MHVELCRVVYYYMPSRVLCMSKRVESYLIVCRIVLCMSKRVESYLVVCRIVYFLLHI